MQNQEGAVRFKRIGAEKEIPVDRYRRNGDALDSRRRAFEKSGDLLPFAPNGGFCGLHVYSPLSKADSRKPRTVLDSTDKSLRNSNSRSGSSYGN